MDKMNETKYQEDLHEVYLWSQDKPRAVFIQPVDDHDLEGMDEEVSALSQALDMPYALAAFRVNDWWAELTPWPAPPVFGNQPFGDGALDTLRFVTDRLLPTLCSRLFGGTPGEQDASSEVPLFLGGYSLAGLFALWSGYQTDVFKGICAASPSLWYPRWSQFISDFRPKAQAIYLSLGDKEELTKNQTMSTIGDRIREQRSVLGCQGVSCMLEWNKGGHFRDANARTAKGFIWLVKNLEASEIHGDSSHGCCSKHVR